jgi:cysteine synthase
MRISSTALDAIGNTPLVELHRVVPAGSACSFVKLEGHNPTGSMKDRMAQSMAARAAADGRLRPAGTVIEYTGGSAGGSLVLVCAIAGYRLRIVSSDAFSEDKLIQMRALGAELTLVPSGGGRITTALILAMIDAARAISCERRTYWTNQLENVDSIAGYRPLGV